jgi:hypothetical protein
MESLDIEFAKSAGIFIIASEYSIDWNDRISG